MSPINSKIAVIVFILLVVTTEFAASELRLPVHKKDFSEVVDALKHLHQLESAYSQMARSRRLHIRSKLDDTTEVEIDNYYTELFIKLLRLNCIDNVYSKLAKPRFGKRASVYDYINRNSKNDKYNQEGSDEYFPKMQQQLPQESQQPPQQDEWSEYRRR